MVAARDGGASDQQIAILERWREVGDTPFGDLDEALKRTFACVETAGLVVEYDPRVDIDEYPEPTYRISGQPDTDAEVAGALIDHCERQESYFVSLAYQLGPGVTARRAREAAEYLPTAIACLEERGVEVPAGIDAAALDAYLIDNGLERHLDCTAVPEL